MRQSEIAAFLKAVQGSRYENLFTVVLFTGLREGEALGLSWDKVDFTNGTILVNTQLQQAKKRGGNYYLGRNEKQQGPLDYSGPLCYGSVEGGKGGASRTAFDGWGGVEQRVQ
ncbi:tyrosine-type recombinase/integrase [Dysosmobacter welbionis]|uniref:tyrosine-type recombinase/integrase n=1 Tax=Dysosmobacter welbionis TaxID=2093857 RepID=UPI00300F3A10